MITVFWMESFWNILILFCEVNIAFCRFLVGLIALVRQYSADENRAREGRVGVYLLQQVYSEVQQLQMTLGTPLVTLVASSNQAEE